MKGLVMVLILGCFTVAGIAQTSVNDSLLREIRSGKQDTTQVRRLLSLSRRYQRSDYDSCLLYARRAIDLSVQLGNEEQVASIYNEIGDVQGERGMHDSAKASFEKALAFYVKEKDTLRISRVYNNLGLMHRYSGNHAESLEAFMQSLRYKEKIHASAKDLATAYQNIGSALAIMQDFEVAEKWMKDALELFRQVGDSSNYYVAVMNLSTVYRDLQRYEESIDLLMEAYHYRLRNGNRNQLGTCLYNLALSSQLNNDTEKAISYYREALVVFDKLGNKRRMMACHQRLANLYYDIEDYRVAEEEALKGLEIGDSITMPFHDQKLNDVLARTYYATGRYKLAYDYQRRSNDIEQSMAEEDHSARVMEIQKKYDEETSKREIAELSVKNAEIEQMAKRRTFINYGLWAAVLIFLLIVVMLYRLYRAKQDANLMLWEKNKVVEHSLEEKDVLLREIHHRVQNNLQFVSSLLNLQSRRVDDEKTLEVLKSCKQRIQSMALIHQKLYQEESLSGISIRNYTKNLVESLQMSYGIDENRIKTELYVDPLYLDINSAISIGLVLSELITNAYKYAFQNQEEGLLEVTLKEMNGVLVMKVKDNGSGLPDDFDLETSESFGLKLVNSLARKLKADVTVSSENGARVELRIKEYTKVNYEQ